jgi:hypothetical protein
MEGRIRFWSLVLAAVCFLSAGCGKENASGTSGSPVVAGDSIDAATDGKPTRRAPADTADAAVLAVVDGLKQNRLEVFWDFLPESFQNDLNQLVHSFAGRMDPELWDKSVDVLRKLARLLKEKKEFLAAARTQKDPDAPPGPSPAELAAVGDLLETLLAGDLADLNKLKTADGGKMLAGTGSRLLAQLRSMGHDPFADRLGIFQDMKVTLVSAREDSAKLRIEVPDAAASDRDFVRVEKRWIPKDLADNWYETIGEANARLSLLSTDNLAATKPQFMGLLSAVDESLERLSAAKTQQQFLAVMKEADEKLQPFQRIVARMMGAAPEEEPQAAAESSDEPIEMVTVVVKGKLGEAAQDNLRDRLNAVTDDHSRAVGEITGDDETTTIRVGPVGDVEAFAGRLDFLKVTRVDPKGRTITAEPKK